VIPNGYDEEDFRDAVQTDAAYFTISYVGTMADSYEPQVFFRALKSLVDTAGQRKIRFRFIGTTPWTLKQMTEEIGLSDVTEWKGPVSHREAIHYMKSSDLLLLLIPVIEGAEGILTGKLFEYLGSGRPILGLGPASGAAAAILNECGAGKMFDREEEGSVREWLNTLYSGNREERGEQSGFKKYSRYNLTSAMAELL
jgi:glycosyltransferase involved in cell wall biosynthesis